MTVPAPPTEGLNPKIKVWKAKRRLFRVHARKYLPDSFNLGRGSGRFHPIIDKNGNQIPTLYASDQINGALAETVFRDLFAGDNVYYRQLEGQRLSRLEQSKALSLVDLTGFGLKKLRLTRANLLEPDEDYYKETAAWAEALHTAAPNAQGMIWVSRQFDKASSILLFGDRIKPHTLKDLKVTEKLNKGRGLNLVKKAALLADITVVDG